MNKLQFIAIFLLAFVLTPKIYCGKLKIAMTNLDVTEVKSLIEKKGHISEAKKKRLLDLFNPTLLNYETESSRALNNNSGIANSILDGAITITSVAVTAAGISALKAGIDAKGKSAFWSGAARAAAPQTTSIFSYINHPILQDPNNKIIAGLTTSALGLGILAYQIKKYRDQNQLNKAVLNFRKAIEIKNLIKKCPIKAV